MGENQITLESMSAGLLTDYFSFQTNYCSYTKKYMETPSEYQWEILDSYEGDSNALCTINMVNGNLVIFISDTSFPNQFKSKIYPGRFNLSGKEYDKYRRLAIQLIDMNKTPQNNNRAEFVFNSGILCSINFVMSEMDDCYHIQEIDISLDGSII